MERFNLKSKALHIGLSPEHNELHTSSKMYKYLDAALDELPVNVMNRLEQVRSHALAAQRYRPFSESDRYRSDR